jgi:putative CocE/NonD family hydrolase
MKKNNGNNDGPGALIREIENIDIPMHDGVRLSARIWMPEDAEQKPVPAILEYIPYRKRDITAPRDALMHPYFAEAGYVSVRVDLRGSGDSEGILRDEYLQEEFDDGVEVIRWLASQPWCSGEVGMIGISWGGFNGLQIAAMAPPALKAIITVCSTDDRFADDVHYMGGCLLTDNLSWASTMFSFNACPPDPDVAGDRWREKWIERLEGSGLWIKKWLEHQHRDDYWKHGSVCEDFSRIKCPVFAVSGWADGYTNSIFRLVEKLSVPRKGMIGPWNHKYPHMGGPGPSIDFIGESLRWWDCWLKGVENDVPEDPMLTLWMQHTVSPLEAKNPGHWISIKHWPDADIINREYKISPNLLYAASSGKPQRRKKTMTIQSPLSVGLFAGKWCSYAASTDLPWDQREEDGGALIFDSEPLEAPLEIVGAVSVELEVSANKPDAMIAVRLSDIAPSGRATRITYGLLNLAHRNSHEKPETLEPGKKYNISIPLNHTAQNMPQGHRLRLAISSSYWPLAWPSPEPVRLSVHTQNCRIYMPIRTLTGNNLPSPVFDYPEQESGLKTTLLVPAHREWTVNHNLATNEVSLNVVNNDASFHLRDINLEVASEVTERYSYIDNNYDTVRGEVRSKRTFKRNDWETTSITRTILTSTRTHLQIRATLDAYYGDMRIFSKTWDEEIRRDML